MIKDIKELNFPKYATMSKATVTLEDMGEKTISSTISIDGEIVPDFSYDWEIVYKGEKYIMPLREPQGKKDNESFLSSVDLTFQHWAIYQLKNKYMFSLVDLNANNPLPGEYEYPISLNLRDFCILLNQVLDYYFHGAITLDFNDPKTHKNGWEYDAEPTTIEISHSYIWDILIKLYELFEVHWHIEPNGDIDNYVIKVGYPTGDISHEFEYGFEGGLMSIERQVQDENIRNMLLGRGGEQNMPYRYFKDIDPDNPDFNADPDWIPELKNRYFANLHGATFRSYIQGWKAAHKKEYQNYSNHKEEYKEKYGYDYPEDEKWDITVDSADKAYAPWAWLRGNSDTIFRPIEFVADEFAATGKGYDVVTESSISKYGELMGSLDNNDEIFPTIQGVHTADHPKFFGTPAFGRVDEVVWVEQMKSDEQETDVPNDATTIPVGENVSNAIYFAGNSRGTLTINGGYFIVHEGKKGNLIEGTSTKSTDEVVIANTRVIVIGQDGEEISASGIPAGVWTYKIEVELENTTAESHWVRVTFATVKLQEATPNEAMNTFDILIKNIWGTSKLDSETEEAYADRVWLPILGGKDKSEAKVIFASGWLSTSEDYEFTIIGNPKHEEVQCKVGNETYTSHWRLKLARSTADYDTLGKLVPGLSRQGNAGDFFFFTGIELPYAYWLWAEEKLDNYKKDALEEKKEIKPTFVVKFDTVRINNLGANEQQTIFSQLAPGKSITLFNKQFISGSQKETLCLQTITLTYKEPTEKEANILPDVEVTLGSEYSTSANPVETLSGEINELRKKVGSLSSVSQIISIMGDKRYLRKDLSDRTPYTLAVGGDLITESNARSRNFASDITGFGWRINEKGDIEADSLTLRKFLEVPELRYNRTEITVGNQWQAPGAGIVESFAFDRSENKITYGTIILKLEDGELGTLKAGDLCMGIWHYDKELTGVNNDVQDEDDGKGNFAFAGFRTVYFRVISVSGSRNQMLEIETRPGYNLQPQAGMNFVAYGNPDIKERQSSCYRTRTYTRYLIGVSSWEFGLSNIAMQLGDLSNLMIFGKNLAGYSAYLDNVYFSGVISQLRDAPLRLTYETYGDTYVGEGDDLLIRFRITKGVEEITSRINWEMQGISAPIIGNTLKITHAMLGGEKEKMVTVTVYFTDTDNTEYSDTVSFIVRDRSELKGDKGDAGAEGSSYTENLLLNTETWDNPWTLGSNAELGTMFNNLTVAKSKTGVSYGNLCLQPYGFSNNSTYTLSFWARGTGQAQLSIPISAAILAVNGVSTEYTANSISNVFALLSSEWKRYSITFKSAASSTQNILFSFINGSLEMAGIKLEIGKNANTAWSPNPSDLRGADGADAVTYEWEVDPPIIQTEANDTYDGDINFTVHCYEISGTKRTEIPLFSNVQGAKRVQYAHSSAGDDPQSWNESSIITAHYDGDPAPRLHLRVVESDNPYKVISAEHVITSVPAGKDGKQGAQGNTGPQGAVTRVCGAFEANKQYWDGTSTADGMRWLDIVWVEDSYGNRYFYRCTKAGKYTEANGPKPSDSQTAAGWERMSDMGALVVDLLCAKNANIQFLSGQEIVFGELVNGSNKIWGRIGAPENDYILWLGGEGTGTVEDSTITFRKDGLAVFGTRLQDRIEIAPKSKQIRVFRKEDPDNETVLIDGTVDHYINGLYGSTNDLKQYWDDPHKTVPDANGNETMTLNNGTIVVGKEGGHLKAQVTVALMTQSVYATIASGLQGASVILNSYASARLYLVKSGQTEYYADSYTNLNAPGFSTIPSANGTINNASKTQTLTIDTDITQGEYSLMLTIAANRKTDSRTTLVAHASATADNYSSQFKAGNNPRTVVGANGILVSNSTTQYLRASKDASGNFMIEGLVGEFGLRITDEGVYAHDKSMRWKKLKLTFESD